MEGWLRTKKKSGTGRPAAVRTGAILAAAMLLGGSAGAQTPESAPGGSGSRLMRGGYVNVNWAYLLADRSWSQSLSRPLYDETATFAVRHAASRGGGLDAAAGLRVFRGLAVGVGAARFRTNKAVALTGSVPHPLFYGADRARPVNESLTGYGRTELGVHLLASWTIPVTGRIDLALSGGPSWFFVDHDHVVDATGIRTTETGSPYNRVDVAEVRRASVRKRVRGANVGVDVTYHLYRSLEPGAPFWTVGVGAFARWTTGTTALPEFGPAEKIDVGGFQTGAGLRFRF